MKVIVAVDRQGVMSKGTYEGPGESGSISPQVPSHFVLSLLILAPVSFSLGQMHDYLGVQ